MMQPRANVLLVQYGSTEVKDLGDFDSVKMTGHLLRDGEGKVLASFYGGAWLDTDGVRWSDVVISPCSCLVPEAVA